jgi:hypothetical protein
MLGIYILAAMLGGGMLVISVLSGVHHDADIDVHGIDADVSGMDVDVGGVDVDVDVSGVDVDAGGLDADHDVHGGYEGAGQLVLGLFRPRNIIFSLTAFGLTGALLTLTGNPESATLGLAIGMGAGAWLLTYGLFTWLKRSESVMDTVGEREIEGRPGRVVLALEPGKSGRISCLIGDREQYLTARLAPEVSRQLASGSEVVILRVEDGVAEVIPFDVLELPPAES